MKQLLLLISVIILPFLSKAQIEELKSLNEYNSGQVNKYSSYGSGKSQGLKIHFKYPRSWESIEGERPHVVRKFAQSDNYVLAILLVNKQEQNIPDNEIKKIFEIEGLKSIIPSSGTYISSNNNLKIEGIKASSIEYTNSAIRMDRTFFSYNLHYVFIYKQYYVNVQFMVVNKIGENNNSVKDRYIAVKPLLEKMFNSIVIDNIWE